MTATTALPRHRHRKPSRLHRLAARWHRPQWPSWLLNWAWNRQATPYVRADPVSQEDIGAWVRTGAWPGYEDGEATRRPGLAARWRTTDGRERDDTPAESSRTARGDGTPPPGTQVAGRQAATGRRAVESRADPRAAGATASRGAQPPAPGLLRRCHLAALWLLAVLGDWWLNWHTWREGRRRAEDIEIARHGAQMARVEHHEPSPAVAAQCAVTALTATLRPDQLLGARHDTPDQTGPVTDWEAAEPATGPIHPPAWKAVQPQTGPLPPAMDEPAPADDPVWPMDRGPLRDWLRDSVVMRALDRDGSPRRARMDGGQLGEGGQFEAAIREMQPPARRADAF